MTTRILVGHVLDQLASLADESVHCVVTSPPYYGLRDYGIEPQVWGGDPGCAHEWGRNLPARSQSGGVAGFQTSNAGSFHAGQASTFCCRCNDWRGSLGLEPTLALYLDHMVEVFREVRRVMRKDATCWLNIGDSYAAQGGFGSGGNAARMGRANQQRNDRPNRPRDGLKPKDLMLIPSRLAIRLQEDGWWVRSDVIWAKKAPMPESCTDRPTSAHEHVFLLTKSARCYYDAEAVKEDAEGNTHPTRKDGLVMPPRGGIDSGGARHSMPSIPLTHRNLRNVWHLGPEPFPEAHFATYPTEIPRRAILAGTSERGVCPKCAAPWARVVETESWTERPNSGGVRGGIPSQCVQLGAMQRGNRFAEATTIGWRPTCGCDAGDSISAKVLDPFLGSGTTALVADRLGRDCIGIELNPDYAAMARHRVEADARLFAEVTD